MQYLKDNIFFALNNDSIKFFEFKEFSFKNIMSYELGNFKIKDIKKAKYSEEILLNFQFKKNIKMINYDMTQKLIKLSKNEIKDERGWGNIFFDQYIDNKNGNIITFDKDALIIWQKDKNNKNKQFIKLLTLKNEYYSLFDINENLFGFQDKKNKIHFYETNYYQCSKIIKYYNQVYFLGAINNEFIAFIDNLEREIFIMDIKFLEIVQIIKFDNNFNKSINLYKMKGNNLYIFRYYIHNLTKELEISRYTFNNKEKYFTKEQILKRKNILKPYSDNNILITDINYIAISNENKMILLYLQ